MSKLFRVVVHPPKLPALKLAAQLLTITVNGKAQPEVNVPLDATAYEVGLFSEGDVIVASLRYQEPDREPGPARSESLIIADDFPTPTPDRFSVENAERVLKPDDPASPPESTGAAFPAQGANETPAAAEAPAPPASAVPVPTQQGTPAAG